MADLRSLSAREAARQIAEGRITAEALAAAYLDRIEAREAVVGAWQYLDRELALAPARRRAGATRKRREGRCTGSRLRSRI